jgi:hypothetical protein
MFFVISVQIYVEIERARLIKKLVKIKEEQRLIAEAADLMQEVAVSTESNDKTGVALE